MSSDDSDCVIISDNDGDFDFVDHKPDVKPGHRAEAAGVDHIPRCAVPTPASSNPSGPSKGATTTVVKGYRAPAAVPASHSKAGITDVFRQLSESLAPSSQAIRTALSSHEATIRHLQAQLRQRDLQISQLQSRLIRIGRRQTRHKSKPISSTCYFPTISLRPFLDGALYDLRPQHLLRSRTLSQRCSQKLSQRCSRKHSFPSTRHVPRPQLQVPDQVRSRIVSMPQKKLKPMSHLTIRRTGLMSVLGVRL